MPPDVEDAGDPAQLLDIGSPLPGDTDDDNLETSSPGSEPGSKDPADIFDSMITDLLDTCATAEDLRPNSPNHATLDVRGVRGDTCAAEAVSENLAADAKISVNLPSSSRANDHDTASGGTKAKRKPPSLLDLNISPPSLLDFNIPPVFPYDTGLKVPSVLDWKTGFPERTAHRNLRTDRFQSPTPIDVVEAPATTSVAKFAPWTLNKANIVAMDCEHVELTNQAGRDGRKAGSVCIVDYFGNVVYQTLVKHLPDTFLVNYHTLRVNGFQRDSLINGVHLETVSRSVESILKGKLVVVVDGGSDFRALGLNIENFQVFDIQDHWKQWNGGNRKDGRKVYEKISLQRLYNFYFGQDFRPDGVHCAKDDAQATMKLFREIYVVMKQSNRRSKANDDYNEFKNIPKLQ